MHRRVLTICFHFYVILELVWSFFWGTEINLSGVSSGGQRLTVIAQSCPTLCDPLDSTVRGSLPVRILEWVAFPFSRASFQLRD